MGLISHIIDLDIVKLSVTKLKKLKVDWKIRWLQKVRSRKDSTSRMAHGRQGW